MATKELKLIRLKPYESLGSDISVHLIVLEEAVHFNPGWSLFCAATSSQKIDVLCLTHR